jgi:undecaprenyl-diphosphatase
MARGAFRCRALALGPVLVIAALAGTAGVAGATGVDASVLGAPALGTDVSDELTTGKAILLGVIEGVTEYLPISSTGHLTVAERVLDIGQTDATAEVTKSYTIIIQVGAILAVLLLYRDRIAQMLRGAAGRSPSGRRLLLALVVAFVPAGVIGFLFDDPIERELFGAGPVAAAWIVGGILLVLYASRLEPPPEAGAPLEQLGLRAALVIGVAQAVALWPGVSRSLVTIVAALLVGLTLPAAVEFSFLLGFATLSAASVYEMVTTGSEVVDAFGWVDPLVGIVAAFVAAAIAIRWMVGYLQSHDLAIFGWYRIAVGVATVALLATGAI